MLNPLKLPWRAESWHSAIVHDCFGGYVCSCNGQAIRDAIIAAANRGWKPA